MKYVNQKKYPHIPYITRTRLEGQDWEKGQKTTISSSGCGLCSAIMVADRLLPNCEFDLDAALRISYETEANHAGGTDYRRFAPAFAEKLGLTMERTNDPERLLYCLRTGGASFTVTTGDRENYIGVFSHGKHCIALIGEEPDGRIAVLDPSYLEGKYEEEGRKGKVEVKNGCIALCSLQVLLEETKDRDPAFYLFWRK